MFEVNIGPAAEPGDCFQCAEPAEHAIQGAPFNGAHICEACRAFYYYPPGTTPPAPVAHLHAPCRDRRSLFSAAEQSLIGSALAAFLMDGVGIKRAIADTMLYAVWQGIARPNLAHRESVVQVLDRLAEELAAYRKDGAT